MLSYDSGDAKEIAGSMRSAMQGVVTGLISQAVRDAHIDGIEIHANDYIGYAGKNMLAADIDKIHTAICLLERLNTAQHEVLIAIYGDGISEKEKSAFRERVAAIYPCIELFEIDGGQDGYDMQLILE